MLSTSRLGDWERKTKFFSRNHPTYLCEALKTMIFGLPRCKKLTARHRNSKKFSWRTVKIKKLKQKKHVKSIQRKKKWGLWFYKVKYGIIQSFLANTRFSSICFFNIPKIEGYLAKTNLSDQYMGLTILLYLKHCNNFFSEKQISVAGNLVLKLRKQAKNLKYFNISEIKIKFKN